MKMGSEELINDLISRTKKVLDQSRTYLHLQESKLNYRNSPESWSPLECLEHLNLYGRFYLKEIKERMNEDQHPSAEVFKSGILGNYFAKSMLPSSTSGKLKKMKTFSNMNPINSQLDKKVIEEFIAQQEEMLRLLEVARRKNLKIKCGITISKLIKLKLGDTFRFVIYHNQRHLIQAERALSSAN